MIEIVTEPSGPFPDAEAAIAHLNAGKRISVLIKGQTAPLASFCIRPSTAKTEATVLMLVGATYLEIGWIAPRGKRVAMLHPNYVKPPSLREARETRAVYRVLNDYLLEGALPDGAYIMPTEAFERRNLTHFMADHADEYSYLIGNRTAYSENCVKRIRNCGSLSDAQMDAVRKRLKSASKPENDDLRAHREEKQREVNERERLRAEALKWRDKDD